MSSYVNRKTRVFTSPGSSQIIQRRSESRLKNAGSATDNRAWCDCVEERRQYILELIKSKAQGGSLGKYIPIEVIIDCLLASKNAQLEALQRELDAYRSLKLTDEQRRQLEGALAAGDAKAGMAGAGGASGSGKGSRPGSPGGVSDDEYVSSPEDEKDGVFAGATPGEGLEDEETRRQRLEGIEGDGEDQPLRSEFQKIVVGERSIGKVAEDGMEKGAMEALSPVKEEGEMSTQTKSEDQQRLNRLAERAVKQLEDIDSMIRSSPNARCNLTCKSQPCPTPTKKLNDMESKKQRLEDLMKERDELRTKISQLEKQLAGGSPGQMDSGISADQLDDRLNQVVGLEIKIQEVLDQLVKEEVTCNTVQTQCTDCQDQKRQSKISELEKELENCRNLKVENAKLQMKVQELQHLEKAQDDLKKKIGAMEGDYNEKYDCLCRMETECISLRNELANCKLLQKERDMLKRQVGDLECCVADLEDEIKRLVGHIDKLTEGRDEQQKKSQCAMTEMRHELELKKQLIQTSEEKLAVVQEELEKSIHGVKCETTCYKSKIEELDRVIAVKCECIETLKRAVEERDRKIDDMERCRCNRVESVHSEDSKLKTLKQDLDNSLKLNDKLQKELEKMVTFKSNENSMKKIVLQSRLAIKRVKEEIDRQYKEWEMGSGENCEKVEELKEMIANLESEISQMKEINDELRGALENQKTCNCLAGLENKSLKKHTTEIQNLAKHQVEELLDHLKKAQLRIIELEDMVDARGNVRLRPETKDSEISCDCDKEELERLKNENDVLKQMMQSEGGEDLLKEIERLKNEMSKLEKENDNLKTKSRQSDTTMTDGGDELVRENEKLKKDLDDLENLKRKLTECLEREKNRESEELQSARGECRRMRETLEEMERMKKQLAECLDKEKTSSALLLSSEDTLKKENEKLNHELDDLKRQLEELKKIKNQLEDSLEKEKATSALKSSSENALLNETDKLRKELEELRKAKDLLADTLEKEKANCAQKASAEEGLRNENDKLKQELEELRRLKQQLSDDLAKEKAKCSEKASAQEDLNRENDRLKKELEELKKLKNQLADSLEKEKANSAQNNSAAEDARRANEKMKKDLEELERMKKQLTDCLEKEKKNSAENASIGDELKKDKEKLKNALDEMERTKKLLSDCLEKEKATRAELSKMQDDLKKENERLKKDLKDMENIKKQLQECLESERQYKAQKASTEDELKKVTENMKRELEEMDRIKRQLTECLEKEKQNHAEKAKKEEALRKEIDDLKKKLEDMEKIKKQLFDCLDREKSIQKEKDSAAGTLKNDLDKLKKELEDMKKQLAESQERERAAKAEKAKAEEELKKERDRMKNSSAELENLKNQLAESREKEKIKSNAENELKQEIDRLKKTLEDMDKIKKQLQDCLEKEKNVVSNKSASLDNELNRLKEAAKDADKLKSENDNLKNQLKELERLKKDLAACLEKEQKARRDADQALKNLELAKASSDDPSALLGQIDDLQNQLNKCSDQNKKLNDELAELRKQMAQKDLGKPVSMGGLVAEDATREELLEEIDRLHATLDNLRNEYEEAIRNLKAQYERDLANLKGASRRSIDELQKRHSQQMEDMERRHDSLLQDLSDELKEKSKRKPLSAHTFCVCSEMPNVVPIITTFGAEIGVHEVDSPIDRPGRWPRPKPATDRAINELLYKAIMVGMEKLSLQELQTIQKELIEATKKIHGKVPAAMLKTSDEDSNALMSRIEQLKDSLEKKQKAAKQKVVTLHMSIRDMEQKIMETRNILVKEKEHNAELKAKMMSMELDSQMLQVDRDLMRQQTNLQEKKIAKLQQSCTCRSHKYTDSSDDQKKRKQKRSRRDSLSTSDSSEVF